MAANIIDGRLSDSNAEISKQHQETFENQLAKTKKQNKAEIHSAENNQFQSSKWTKHSKTLLACLFASLGYVSLGTTTGYSSLVLLDLNAGNKPFHLNEMEISWVISTIPLGGLIGALLGGLLLDRYGRKLTIISTTVPYAISWTIIASSPNVYCLCIGRFLSGVCGGIMDVGVTVYISEISASSVRGFMGSSHEIATNFGGLIVFAFSCFLHWNWMAIACMCIPVMQVFCMLLVPESPRWLLSKGHKQAALTTLHWLRGENEDVSSELSEIEENIKLCTSNTKVEWSEFAQPVVYKPLVITVGLFFCQNVSGYLAIDAYIAEILFSVNNSWNPFVQTTVLGGINLLSSFLSALVVDRAGRRTMLLLSSSGMAISMAGLAIFFTPNVNITTLAWLPILSLIGYYCAASWGYGPIPFYIHSELFPLRVRGLAGGIGLSSYYTFSFLSTLAFPHLRKAVNDAGVYWIFTGFCVLGFIFAVFAMPETKGKSLEEIEAHFRK